MLGSIPSTSQKAAKTERMNPSPIPPFCTATPGVLRGADDTTPPTYWCAGRGRQTRAPTSRAVATRGLVPGSLPEPLSRFVVGMKRHAADNTPVGSQAGRENRLYRTNCCYIRIIESALFGRKQPARTAVPVLGDTGLISLSVI